MKLKNRSNYLINNSKKLKKTTMLKYLNTVSRRLEEIKRGMENNIKTWEQMPENPSFVETLINEVNEKNNEIENLKKTLSKKYSEARSLSGEKKIILNRLEKRAIGLHADAPEKLYEYGIK